MKRSEAAELMGYIVARDRRETSEAEILAMAEDLEHVSLDDARWAVREFNQQLAETDEPRSPYIRTHDILRLLRQRRGNVDLRAIESPDPPHVLADYPQVEAQWTQRCKRRIAEGADRVAAYRQTCEEFRIPYVAAIEPDADQAAAMREIAGGEF